LAPLIVIVILPLSSRYNSRVSPEARLRVVKGSGKKSLLNAAEIGEALVQTAVFRNTKKH